VAKISLTYLSGPDIDALNLTPQEILAAVESGLAAQGRSQTVVEPRVHLQPDPAFEGHFNVLRGYIAPLDMAGVKIVGDYVTNYQQGLPSEMGLLNLFDPRTGTPRAILDATAITDMRTGAVSALGAKFLAPREPKVFGNIGARGSSYWNVRLMDHLFDLDTIRVHSRRRESREAFGARLSADLGREIVVAEDWESCLADCDIIVEATRLPEPHPHLKTEWIKPGSLIIPYGTMSAVELSLTDVIDKFVMDDWGQAHAGQFGSLRRHVDCGRLNAENLHAELGQIAAGLKPGRESDAETILFWHRGLSLSDIALGAAMLEKAERLGLGQQLIYA